MTLVIGIRCLDGFVIAADDEESDGVKKSVRKVIGTPQLTPEHPYSLAIAFAGDSHGCQSAAHEIKGLLELDDGPPLVRAEAIIRDGLRDYYFQKLGKDAQGNIPPFAFVVGYCDRSGGWGLWLFNEAQWLPIQEIVSIGSGQDIAYSVARRMFQDHLSLQVAHVHHLATQIVREGRKAEGVGGTIHTWSVRARSDTAPFVNVSTGNTDYLWGLQDRLFSSLRGAMKGDANHVAADVDEIHSRLKRMIADIHAASWAVRDFRTIDPPAGHPLRNRFR